MAYELSPMPAYSGKLLRSIVNDTAKDLGLTWQDNADALGLLARRVARDLDALGPLAVLVPIGTKAADLSRMLHA